MVNLFSWIFTLGGIFSYLILFIHSIKGKEREQTSSLFIFIGGFIVALLLEFTLTIILNAYTYQNLPLTIFSIPIVIPLGWVITFYCILELNIDLLQELNQSKNYILLILLIFIS
ncbi:MAG: hypothetical protein OEY10_03810, partial [Nitrosopumilus sp.]|nr:hypothetical protein [Nitrosopumilus sp.]